MRALAGFTVSVSSWDNQRSFPRRIFKLRTFLEFVCLGLGLVLTHKRSFNAFAPLAVVCNFFIIYISQLLHIYTKIVHLVNMYF